MALTYTPVTLRAHSTGDKRNTVTDITLDGSYTAGGITLSPQQMGLTRVDYGWVGIKTSVAVASPSGGALICTDPYNPVLKLQGASNLAELANGAGTGAIVEVFAYGAA